jgi:hypothetical protein
MQVKMTEEYSSPKGAAEVRITPHSFYSDRIVGNHP